MFTKKSVASHAQKTIMNAHSLKSLGAPIALVGWALSVGSCAVAAADPSQDMALKLSDSIANGRLLLEIRPRFAVITETNKPEKTEAWTVCPAWGGRPPRITICA